ncbi:hypothetical protein [Sulfurovum sp. bin170]|uniref:hypothetical protein n=1 Tax=Sulfurovum sp. bin170 TaxID=2695268 RepID=UPI0021037D3C|nr:hypothetical protein [Sulfurovum sp. bin170]
MTQENKAQKERLDKIFRRVKILYGDVPPQMKFLGSIEADYLEDFLKTVMRVVKHPNINPDLFGFIRLNIAFREDYAYCKMWNTKFLLAKEYTQEQLDRAIADIADVPFDDKHKALAIHAIKAIYESKKVTQNNFEQLYKMGWSQKDVFDVIEHAGMILRNGRILTAYMVK